MEVSDKKVKEITRKIMVSRMRLLVNNGFYGLLLMHMKISLSEDYETAWTDCNDRIFFNPKFVDSLSDRELDYALMHQVIHASLRHSNRRGDYKENLFDEAADIVVNSNILLSNSGNEGSIELRDYGGVQPHTAPDGTEGYNFSVEELYRLLEVMVPDSAENSEDNSEESDDCDGNGNTSDCSKSTGNASNDDSAETDSNKVDKRNGKSKSAGNNNKLQKSDTGWDIHVNAENESEDDKEENKQKWENNIRRACEAISIRDPNKQRGLIPMFAERIMNEFTKPQTDWRQLLTEFVQDEINDYSFTPPDRRMDDSPFFLPDYNERDYKPGKILFMIDTSGSMSNSEITECYSEVKGAVDQFDGKLEGLLGFFDAVVIDPIPFEDEEELLIIRPKGGGGTSFKVIFDYIQDEMIDDLPQSVVILTDGYAPWPAEDAAMGIPVLWIINNEKVTPPWGVVARIGTE